MNSSSKFSAASFALLCACALWIGGVGCQQDAAPVQAEAERPNPEKSFTEVVDIFTDGIDVAGGSASGFVAQTNSASARFQVHNTVTSKLIPPAAAADPYRGTITVTTQSIYSLRQTPKDDDDQTNANANGGNDFERAAEGSEIESFDPGLISDKQGEKKTESDETPTVQRRPDKIDRVYELVYKDGRWELVTKLDLKTEAAIANAFDRALRLQP